ncbi:hypothetical protein L6R52_27525, partial [Myxococcota bacterium]|nr:hypothetical protein [Myxococcota bacterium]
MQLVPVLRRVALLGLLASIGCGEEVPGGALTDVGPPPRTDAGMITIDGGFDDAGSLIDGGVITADASAPGDASQLADAGIIEVDGGFDDAGNAIDGGVITADASEPSDASASADGGPPADAGAADATPSDTGVVAIDGGVDDRGLPIDGGFVPVDAGAADA